MCDNGGFMKNTTFNLSKYNNLKNKIEEVSYFKNAKGGTWKTGSALQTAHRLATLGYRTLMITSDSQNNALDYSGINKEFKKQQTLEYWLKKGEGEFIELRKNLYYIAFESSGLSNKLEDKFNSFIADMLENKRFDHIVIDGTPVLKLDKIFTKAANHIFIPTCLDNATINSTTDFINSIDVNKVRYIIPCRFNRTAIETTIYHSIKEFLEGSSINLTEPIKTSSYVAWLLNNGKTIWDSKSKKVEYVRNIIDKMIESTFKINIIEREYEQKNKIQSK